MDINQIIAELEQCVAQAKLDVGFKGADKSTLEELESYMEALQFQVAQREVIQGIMGLPQGQLNIGEVASILGLIQNNSIYTAIFFLKESQKAS